MRQLDEILWSYGSQGTMAKAFLLRRLERQPITVDSAVALDLLEAAESGEVADSARLAEDVFWSRRLEDGLLRAGGDPPREAGNWTRFLGHADAGATRVKVDGGDVEQAAASSLATLVPPLQNQARAGGRRSVAALRVLGRIRIPASLEAIQEVSGPGAMAPLCMAAYAVFGGDEAAGRAMDLATKRSGTPVFSGLVQAFRGVPSRPAFEYLSGLVDREEKVRPWIAYAMEGFGDYDYQKVLTRLLESRDPWTVIQSVETMGRLGGAELTRRIGSVFRGLDHPLARVACLQAVAAAGERQGFEMAMEALATSNPVVQAAAVETLVKLPVPPEQYSEKVLALLDTRHPKLAMNVALATTLLDPRRAVRRVKDLLASGNPQELLQGIHCLAYMDYPQSSAILATVVSKASPGAMRIQAIRALGRRATDDPQAAAYLSKLLELDDPVACRTAAWFLSGVHPSARRGCAGVLGKALQKSQDVETRVVLADSLGQLGPEAASAAGALEGAVELGGPAARAAARALATALLRSPEAERLGKSRDAGVRAYGALRRWILGDTDLTELGVLVGGRDEESFLAAAQVARVVAETAVMATEASLLEPLAKALGEAFREASSKQAAVGGGGRSESRTETSAEIAGKAQEAAGLMPPLAASGRNRNKEAYGGDRIRASTALPQPKLGGSAMLSEEEAALALEGARQVSGEDQQLAVERSTYFEPSPGTGPRSAPATSPPGGSGKTTAATRTTQALTPAQVAIGYFQMLVFAIAAIALGRLARIYLIGG